MRFPRTGYHFLWVLDKNDQLLGWINTAKVKADQPIENTVTRLQHSRMAVSKDSTLKEALARMLGEGVKLLPVINDNLEVVGEIGLLDIEKVTEEVTDKWQD